MNAEEVIESIIDFKIHTIKMNRGSCPLKILQYNVFEGCQDEKKLPLLLDFLWTEEVDIAGFNELNGWSTAEFQKRMEMAGLCHTALFEMETSPFYIGLASRYPIEIIEKNEVDFHHGYLHARTNGIHFLITHLSPKDAAAREQEAEKIAKTVKQVEEPFIVMGDLNTLSQSDGAFYESQIATLLDHPRLVRKFMKNGVINTGPMDILLKAGLADTIENDGFQPTVPTAMNDDVMHALPMRLDYILVNELIESKNPHTAVVVNEQTDKISDHFPIICEWE
jgi:endonuclease/exonuclease/phosphatase family metal-dependent hydrolase